MIFADPWNIVWLLIAVPLVVLFYMRTNLRGRMKFSNIDNLKKLKPSFSQKLRHSLIILRIAVLTLVVIALMRPQKGIDETKIESEGIDIVLCVDVSGSMMAEDFQIQGQRRNRLAVVKEVVKEFIAKRTNDRIGLVVFAGQAYMQCPLTLDYGVLLKFLDKIEIGMIEDGTAVGDGIATSLARLKDIESKSKIVILLTDGVNNAGKVDPANASGLAKALGVKIYTVGAGSKGRVPFPARDMFGNKVYQYAVIDIDEESLKNIASVTVGRYFRALDTQGLRDVYDEIDRLEKTKVEVTSYTEYRELFPVFIIIALLLLMLETVLRYTRLRTLP